MPTLNFAEETWPKETQISRSTPTCNKFSCLDALSLRRTAKMSCKLTASIFGTVVFLSLTGITLPAAPCFFYLIFSAQRLKFSQGPGSPLASHARPSPTLPAAQAQAGSCSRGVPGSSGPCPLCRTGAEPPARAGNPAQRTHEVELQSWT